jgi:SAM-dependent methyltransferase
VQEQHEDSVGRAALGDDETRHASRAGWDAEADGYQDEHGAFLGDADFVWCPEGLREADARLLGETAGRDVLEIGCGAAQCARWLVGQGARAVGIDLSLRQLQHSLRLDDASGVPVATAVADACALPFADASFDVVCSAFGAVPFVATPATLMREVARVLRPGGRFVFSVSHPLRWAFPDVPGEAGLTADHSYWDRRAYVERDDDGVAVYVEHHRTLGDRVRDLVAAGLVLDDLVEPEWPEGLDAEWGGWSPLRGKVIPGTAIFVTHRA